MPTATNNQESSIFNRFGVFYNLFKGFESFIRTERSKAWLKTSRFYELTRKDLLDSLKLTPETRRAFKISSKSDFFVLRIADGTNIDASLFTTVLETLRNASAEQFGIYKDCVSEDIHIYIYLQKAIDSSVFIEKINKWINNQPAFASLDAEFIDGPISIPCQSGFSWLNEQGNKIVSRNDITELAAVSMFLSEFESKKICGFTLLERVEDLLVEYDHLSIDSNSASSDAEETPELAEESESQSNQNDDLIDFSPSSESNVIDLNQAKERLSAIEVEEQDSLREQMAETNVLPPPGAKSFKQLQIQFGQDLSLDQEGRPPP